MHVPREMHGRQSALPTTRNCPVKDTAYKYYTLQGFRAKGRPIVVIPVRARWFCRYPFPIRCCPNRDTTQGAQDVRSARQSTLSSAPLKGRAGEWPSGVMARQCAQAPALPFSHMRLPQSETIYTAQLQRT